MHRSQSPTQRHNESQQGSIVVILAASIGMLMVLLASIQIGYAAYMKRELQKAADMAALSGVQALTVDDESCSKAKLNADSLADANISNTSFSLIECGQWKGDSSGNPSTNFQAGVSPYNALRVRISKEQSPLVPFIGTDTPAEAVATATISEPVATFSVGSELLSLSKDGLLGKLLSTLALSPEELTLLSSDGLANVHLTPSGLLQGLKEAGLDIDLSAGTRKQLLNLAPVTLGNLLTAAANVLANSPSGNSNNNDIDLALLRSIGTALDIPQLAVQLFGDETKNGLLNLGPSDPTSALAAKLNLGNLIAAGLLTANTNNLIDLQLPNEGILNVLRGQLRIIEPPTIAIGGEGTAAHSAQLRLYLYLSSDEIPVVGLILNTLGTYVHLPIILDVATSRGTLEKACTGENRDGAVIAVKAAAASLCIGKFSGMTLSKASNAPSEVFYQELLAPTNSCFDEASESSIKPERFEVLNVLGVLPVRSSVAINLIPGKETDVELRAPATTSVDGTNVDLSGTINNIIADAVLDGILGDMLGYSTDAGITQPDNPSRQAIAEQLVGTSGAGKSLSDVNASLVWSQERMEEINNRMTNNGLVGVLGGTLGILNNALSSIFSAVGDVLCLPAVLGGNNALRSCRTGMVKTFTLANGDSFAASTVAIALAILKPLLDPISTVINNLLSTLGISIVNTDVTLHSVQCGLPRLVQ
ncbi:TadG family pilus assembly protein [Allopusillimonas soli]|uniref:DUF2134 domain-containing protein n=1 Tax=Allopusillimonas soli TaxID=659016 RepID=A0A853FK92_9BURK|nr:TadG family pilus assembly protein [Allopusillimonas soli]NYT38791.1 hypothetical protein [Allopusillimonas soli]